MLSYISVSNEVTFGIHYVRKIRPTYLLTYIPGGTIYTANEVL